MATPENSKPRVHRIAGVPYDAGTDTHCEAVDVAIKTQTDRADKAEANLKIVTDKADQLAKDLAAATDPKTIATAVRERVKLLDFAGRVEDRVRARDKTGKAKCEIVSQLVKNDKTGKFDKKAKDVESLGNPEMLKMCLSALYPDLDVSAYSPAQLEGAYMMAIQLVAPGASPEVDPALSEPTDGAQPPQAPEGEEDPKQTGDARGRMRGDRADTNGQSEGGFKTADQIQAERAERDRTRYQRKPSQA